MNNIKSSTHEITFKRVLWYAYKALHKQSDISDRNAFIKEYISEYIDMELSMMFSDFIRQLLKKLVTDEEMSQGEDNIPMKIGTIDLYYTPKAYDFEFHIKFNDMKKLGLINHIANTDLQSD